MDIFLFDLYTVIQHKTWRVKLMRFNLKYISVLCCFFKKLQVSTDSKVYNFLEKKNILQKYIKLNHSNFV